MCNLHSRLDLRPSYVCPSHSLIINLVLIWLSYHYLSITSSFSASSHHNRLHSGKKGMTTAQTSSRRQRSRCPCAFISPASFLPPYPNLHLRHIPTAAVASPSPTTSPRQSRFSRPVPPPKPHEIPSPRRGRDSRRRIRQAENFHRYIYLRRQLKPWSDSFRSKHGRTPSLLDVYKQDIPGLLERFVEYLDALENLRIDV